MSSQPIDPATQYRLASSPHERGSTTVAVDSRFRGHDLIECGADLTTAPAVATSIWPALAGAAALALVVLYGVAFAASPLTHNAAHDVRHITVKPCH